MAEKIRGDLPEVAAEWLAPIAPDFEALTEEREGESDEQWIGRIQSFIENIDQLYEKMDRQSLENSLYAANAEGLLLGIGGRISQANRLRYQRNWRFRKKMSPRQ